VATVAMQQTGAKQNPPMQTDVGFAFTADQFNR
jgi:hypothetical protein